MPKAQDYLIWIDLEMTGLEVERERIIESAIVITDSELEIVAVGPELVLRQPEDLLARMDEWNQRQHKKSGLLERVRQSSLSEAEAERRMLAFVEEHCQAGKAPMVGNSVHMDRSFLRSYMPKLESYFHYRNVDVSSIKELARRWYPEIHANAPKKKGLHRAVEDIRDSIAELKYYRSAVFQPPEPKRSESPT